MSTRFSALAEMLFKGRKRQVIRDRKGWDHASKHNRLKVERLEARCMLAAGAIGSFVRLDGSAFAEAALSADSPPDYSAQSPFEEEEVIAHASEGVSANGDGGSANAIGQATGVIPTPIGSSIKVIQLNTGINSELQASASEWFARAIGSVTASALASYSYVADPAITENLVFHGHMFVAGNGGIVESGDGEAGGPIGGTASISGGRLTLALGEDGWQLSGVIQAPGSSAHYHFVVPITNGASIVLGADSGSHSGALVNGDGSATLHAGITTAAWGYVTAEGEDLTPGDFNGDGAVDGDDLQLWTDGSPQADVNEDAVVDEGDYAIWLANAAPKVSNVTISSTVSNPSGTNPPYSFAEFVGSEEQLRTVPVGGANQLAIQFTKDVDISSSDLDLIALNRVVNEPSVSSFTAPDSSNDYTATWTFASMFPGAQYLVRLADSIVDLDGNALDGEWTNPGSLDSSVTTSDFPSGDHFAGGDFEFVFTYLPGDANRDNVVDNADFAILGGHYGMLSNMAWGNADFTGDGAVDSSDFAILAGYYGLAHWKDLEILADYDGDFDLESDDETDFLALYGSQNSAADLNDNGTVSQTDYDAFYELFSFGVELDVFV